MTTSTLMCFPLAVAIDAPSSASQSVKRVPSPRRPPTSISSEAFCSQLRRFEKYSTPTLTQRRPRNSPTITATVTKTRVPVGLLGRALGGFVALCTMSPRTIDVISERNTSPETSPPPRRVLAREPLQRDPEAECPDLREEHPYAQLRLEGRPLLVELCERLAPGLLGDNRGRRRRGGGGSGARRVVRHIGEAGA